MKICFVSYEYEPFPGGGIATYHNAAARMLVAAGHEVHIVTNRAWHGRNEPHLTQRLWTDGKLTIHRLRYFDEKRNPPPDAQFFDINTSEYSHKERLWAREPSNLAAHQAAAYIEALHRDVGLDVIEAPEFFAEAFYVIRRRMAGDRPLFPPVCVHGHISSRIAFAVNHHAWELGWEPHRHMMLREEYTIQHADALITPSRSLMQRYEKQFGDALPEIRATILYFLEVPEDIGKLPKQLQTVEGRYLALIGRVEPRKGPDVAMRAFALLADDFPGLRLVLMGKEMWHWGESVDDVIAGLMPEQHRKRVVRLGQVPREQALAVARNAAAFLHPAPWDNYPCAVLEAMAVGATCIVSDSGGQSEMVVDGESGLIHPAGDAEALAVAIRRVLEDRELEERLARNAVTRVNDITAPEKLAAEKLKVFEAMVEREHKALADPLKQYRMPEFVQANTDLMQLPGKGIVILDGGGAKPGMVESSRDSLWNEVRSSSESWQLCAMLEPDQEVELAAPWSRRRTIDPPAWLDLPDDHIVVYVAAGTRFDLGHLQHLVAQVVDSPVPCGSFAWLRPASSRVFPYASDFSWHDLLTAGHLLPPVFAVKVGYLKQCSNFAGLRQIDQRLSALQAASSAAGDLVYQHVGQICGDYYGDLPLVNNDTQLRAAGYLEILGLLPASKKIFGAMPIPLASTPEHEAQQAQQQKQAQGKSDGGGQQRTAQAEQPTVVARPQDNGRMRELEEVYRQHMALKQMKIVRWMRKARIFDVARKLTPRSKKFFGSGR